MIQDFTDWLVYSLFGLDPASHLGSAVNFFFYDTIKILILLFFISILMGIINAYFPIDQAILTNTFLCLKTLLYETFMAAKWH